MQNAVKRLCPYCAQEVPLASSCCIHCGRDLHQMMIARSTSRPAGPAMYYVVPDGLDFGIAVAGEVKIHGLTLNKARRLVELLNSVGIVQAAR